MPQSPPILDLASLDLSRVVVGPDQIRAVNPHRHEFELLHGLVHFDRASSTAVGFRDVGADEYWVRGHIPGRPLFPGVLQIETIAQLSSYVYNTCFEGAPAGFFGFAGLEKTRFLGMVVPGDRFLAVVRARRMRSKMAIFDTQGFVGTKMVFEGELKGALM